MCRLPASAALGAILLIACGRPAMAPSADRLVAAVRADSLTGVLSLLDSGALPDAAAGDGTRPLTEATRLGRDTIIAELLRAGADPTLTDAAGWTTFDHAMALESPATLDLLILHAARSAGAGPRVVAWFTAVPLRHAPSPPWQDLLSGELLSLGLMYAALHDRTDLIGAMRRAREVPNGTGYHALAVAARHGREQAVWALLGVDTHPDQVTTGTPRSTALMEAGRGGHVAIGRRLLAAGARVDRPDARGETALHWAARHGRTGFAEMLLEHGAARAVRNRDGRTPAALAAFAGHQALAARLDPEDAR
jgi:ankyrin repeat protein